MQRREGSTAPLTNMDSTRSSDNTEIVPEFNVPDTSWVVHDAPERPDSVDRNGADCCYREPIPGLAGRKIVDIGSSVVLVVWRKIRSLPWMWPNPTQ